MDDSEILILYFERDETAITETEAKYGAFCRHIALNILSNDADAEECVNDALMQAWNAIPPQKPEKLGSWLGRVVRNLSLDRWRTDHRRKRYAGMEELLDELEDCIPSADSVEKAIEEKELTELINKWLAELPREDRILFVQRYWNGVSLSELARDRGISPAKAAKRMYRLRQSLRHRLESEDYSL